jgi:hypothetical protein
VRALSYFRPGHMSGRPEPPAHYQAHKGDDGAHTEPHAHNLCHRGHSDREWCSLIPEGPGPKAFRSNMHDTCFLKCFRAPSNITEYDGKTISIVWLEDYILACRATRADSGLFIVQFLPIYLADTSRVWHNYLHRNSLDC